MTKTEQLQALLARLESGSIGEKDLKRLSFVGPAGEKVKLSDPRAAELLRQRIDVEK